MVMATAIADGRNSRHGPTKDVGRKNWRQWYVANTGMVITERNGGRTSSKARVGGPARCCGTESAKPCRGKRIVRPVRVQRSVAGIIEGPFTKPRRRYNNSAAPRGTGVPTVQRKKSSSGRSVG